MEVPDDTSSITLHVIHKANHFKPLTVDLNYLLDDDMLPDWQMKELSLCGYIMMYDQDLSL